MRDPHIVRLRYRLETASTLRFPNPPPLELDRGGFKLRLEDGILTAEPCDHHSTADQAQAALQPVLNAWEIDWCLRFGPGAVCFHFEGAEVVDRNPPGPGDSLEPTVLHARCSVRVGGSATVVVHYPCYPDVPTTFAASEHVLAMWHRYERYKEGKEPLQSMAYFCLTLLEGSTGQKAGARSAVCRLYNIEQAVRDKLGDLTSARGDSTEARKMDAAATGVPLTAKEKSWVEEVVRALIRRKAEYDARPGENFTPITMSDFIALD